MTPYEAAEVFALFAEAEDLDPQSERFAEAELREHGENGWERVALSAKSAEAGSSWQLASALLAVNNRFTFT